MPDPAFEERNLVLGEVSEEQRAEVPLEHRVQAQASESQDERLAVGGRLVGADKGAEVGLQKPMRDHARSAIRGGDAESLRSCDGEWDFVVPGAFSRCGQGDRERRKEKALHHEPSGRETITASIIVQQLSGR